MGITENLHIITAKLLGDEKATAFSINRSYVITARHAVKQNIKENSSVNLEFYEDGGRKSIKRTAIVVHHSEEYDIAILKLNKDITHINNWIELSDQIIKADDSWETAGFPVGWDEVKEGSKYCYIRGEVFQNFEFDLSTKYDIHLASTYIKEEWEYTFGGLSGAAIISGGKIVGIIIDEEYSVIKSPLKAISIKRIKNFLIDSRIGVESSLEEKQELWQTKNRLSMRMKLQKNTCEELFLKVELKNPLNANLSIDSFILKYNDDGTQKVKNLAKYISDSLMQYACSLVEINKGCNDLTKMMKVIQKVNLCITKIKEKGMLGRVILWMILEGAVGAPKAFLRLPLDKTKEYCISEVHIGISDNGKLILYLGDSKLRDNLAEAVVEAIQSLEKEIKISNGIIDIENDIYIADEYVYDNIESNKLKDLLEIFIKPNTRDWSDVEYELTIFTGYNASIYNGIERLDLSVEEKEQYLEQIFNKECDENQKIIHSKLNECFGIIKLKINWFILPFDTIESFEGLVLSEIEGGNQ